MLTGNKDVDRKILNILDDKDLVNVCKTNKKANIICNDQVFWMNRVFGRFGYVGGDTLRKYKKDRTWSEYYIKDLRNIGISNTPTPTFWKFFGYKTKNPSVNEYLISGAKDGRLDHVIISLKNGADIHIGNNYALIAASSNGYLEMVKYLVSQGADIHRKGNLINEGDDIHINDDSAIVIANYNGHVNVVKYLMSQGSEFNVDDGLIVSSSTGYLDLVKYLITLGTNIHAKKQALKQASYNGHLDIVRFLKRYLLINQELKNVNQDIMSTFKDNEKGEKLVDRFY